MTTLLTLLTAFLLGALPWGLWVAQRQNIDLRTQGSGNLGATNVYRVMGWKWGVLVLVLDIGKGVMAVVVARVLVPGGGFPAAAALAAVGGHMFTPFARFRGGKGVATSVGVILGLAPVAGSMSFLVWLATLGLCGWVSVASGMASIVLPVLVILTRADLGPEFGWVFVLSLTLSTLVLVRHRTNWKRVAAGTEQAIWEQRPESPAEGALPREPIP